MNPADYADIEIDQLIGLFYDSPDQLGHFKEVGSGDVPVPICQLLAHDGHMTETVERFHDCPVDVRVLQSRIDGDRYSRKIVLTRQSDDRVVMYGIVRLDLSLLSADVRSEVESQQIPLGRILIEHNVMRVVKLLELFEISPGEDLAQLLSVDASVLCYGRTALIFCDGVPAIALLEIVPAGIGS